LIRNNEIKTSKSKNIDPDRFRGASTELIMALFTLLMMPAVKYVKRKNPYNFDEVGTMEGIGHNGLVLSCLEKKQVLKEQPGSPSWTSIFECCSVDGES
jgi:hypothetical protein